MKGNLVGDRGYRCLFSSIPEKKWEIFDQSSTEDRNELVHELLKCCWVAKYEDLSDILERSPSSAERYIKQAIDSGFLKEEEWQQWKRAPKKGD